MEDDDEFGDLYTDVLRPLTTTSAPAQSTVATSSSRAIDLNTIHGGDDDEILYGAAAPITNSNPSNFKISLDGQQTLAQDPFTSDLAGNSIKGPEKEGNSVGTGSRVLDKGFEDPNFMDESGIDIVVEERDDDKDVNLENFEGNSGIDINSNNLGNLEPVITGLSMPRVSENGGLGEGDDWGDDSDSEDDLQIVLNDNTRIMGMDRGGEEDDGEDEDGDNLVILADTDPNHHQPMEEQEWGEDAAQGAAEGGGERKDLGDSTAKINGAAVAQTKIGYSGFHHPFHSQFKYVRPGAPPLPGAAPVASGGPPCQVRPPVGIVPFAGRGRGDWRPTGIRGAAPIQKNFPGYGMPAWGNSGSGRGFGSGLEFTLPSHKTIFEVDIDSFEEKPWRLPGIDISDFFNFGLNEESWKEYCKQLEQLRLEATMQSKIRVYESGRSEQEYDPDLPPELAAAAGIHDISAETPNLGKVDPGQGDLAKGSIRVRPQPPPGRAIQVETGYGERLPSIDTRPPRIRDSDAIIEIVLQDSGYDDSSPGNNIVEQPYNNPSRENTRRVNEHEENTAPDETNGFEGEPVQDLRDSRGKSSAFSGRKFNITPDERRTKNQVSDRSPVSIHSASTQDKKLIDDQKEESLESVGAKPSPSSSPVTGGSVKDHDFDQNDAIHDGPVPADGSSEMRREEALDTTTTDKLENETRMHSVKKQKLISRAEPPSHRELDEGEDSKAARSSDNSRARSGSSRDYRNTGDGVDDEVVQAGRSRHLGMGKRPPDEDERMVRGRGRDERQEMEKHRAQMKGREDSYSRKKWESNMTHHSHVKNESLGRRKDGDSDGVWQRKDDDIQGGRPKAEDKRKRERGDEMVSGHRSKVRENERSDKDEHQLRKVLDNGSWKGYHEKDSLLRHKDRDDNLKNQNDIMDDPHSKRRKDERREYAEKEETLHVHKESNSRRKRERDEILDQRKREDLPRLRDDDQHAVRHNKEEVWLQRERVERKKERDEWHRLKQSHDENLIKREKEEVRGGMRSGRVVEDKAWAGHSRVKEEYKAPDREYQIKDSGRHSEQLNRRDRVENDSLSRHRGRDGAYARGNQLGSEERRSRQERGSAGTDRPVGASDNHRAQEKKHRENTRKSKESDIADRNSLPPSRRNRGDHGGQRSERVSLGGMLEQGSGEHDFPVNRQASRKHKEDASSDDEQRDSKKGRSKLERWTSHKERDFTVGIKPSASTNVKEIDRYNDVSSLVSKDPDESFKAEETIENSEPLAELKDDGLTEFKNDDSKPAEDKDKHLDTVEKLKKRSERFKLPMPSEKETLAIKKIENEPLPSVQVETLADSEVKHERPTRKRRWTSS